MISKNPNINEAKTIQNWYQKNPDSINSIQKQYDENDLSTISQIYAAEPNIPINTIAIIFEIGESINITTKDDKELLKREITIVDKSEEVIKLILWSNEAEHFKIDKASVIIINKARIKDYKQTRVITYGRETTIKKYENPNGDELKTWYEEEGKLKIIEKITNTAIN